MISLLLAGTLQMAAGPALSTCTLRAAGANQWQGSCPALIEGADATLTLKSAATVTSGVWRRDAKPASVWSGTMTAPEVPATPVEVEVYADHRGVMRSMFGWFTAASTMEGDTLHIEVDSAHEAPPSAVDREIVERASRILADEAVWNRADNRRCPAEATTWSIYCAMEKATVEVSGAFHHRRPAMQTVRTIVDERSAGRPYDHRLMDYNNDATTKLADVQSLFAEALRRIDAAK